MNGRWESGYAGELRKHDNAKVRKRKGKHYPLGRSEHIKVIREHGVINWQKTAGYGERSLVDLAFFCEKRIVGRLMYGINLANQKVAAKLACKILNVMTIFGMPEIVRIN